MSATCARYLLAEDARCSCSLRRVVPAEWNPATLLPIGWTLQIGFVRYTSWSRIEWTSLQAPTIACGRCIYASLSASRFMEFALGKEISRGPVEDGGGN